MSNKSEVFIIYRESKRSKKLKSKIFENVHVDDILDTSKRKPLVPVQWELEAILVGKDSQYIKILKRKFKIK